MKLIMPANMSEERRAAMAAFGAELISVPGGKMELARDLAAALQVPWQAGLCRRALLCHNPHAQQEWCCSITINLGIVWGSLVSPTSFPTRVLWGLAAGQRCPVLMSVCRACV